MISPKEFRRKVSQHEVLVNTINADARFVRDSFLLMGIADKYRFHKYYQKQMRKIRMGEQDRINFAKEEHKSTKPVIVHTNSGPITMTAYNYSLYMAGLFDGDIAKRNEEHELYSSNLAREVEREL